MSFNAPAKARTVPLPHAVSPGPPLNPSHADILAMWALKTI